LVLKFFRWVLISSALLSAQKPDSDAPGCVDSRIVPRLPGCRIDNCEHKDADRREVTLRENEKGEPVTTAVEGESRSVMYECAEKTTPSDIVAQAAAALKAAQFDIPYQFSDQEGTITARKGELWVVIDAASRYYTLAELKAQSSDESEIDAAEMADAIERHGRVAIPALGFTQGSAELTPESAPALQEIEGMLEDNPGWRIRVEGHSDNPSLAQRRSAAVVSWLVLHQIKRERLESTGLGDAQPGTNKNHRIELVRIDQAPK
jgi:outer membrane protein OmpA-like peptidoglycan-associated protein